MSAAEPLWWRLAARLVRVRWSGHLTVTPLLSVSDFDRFYLRPIYARVIAAELNSPNGLLAALERRA